MTNEQYRKSRGTHKPAKIDPERAKREYNEIIRQRRVASGMPERRPESAGKDWS